MIFEKFNKILKGLIEKWKKLLQEWCYFTCFIVYFFSWRCIYFCNFFSACYIFIRILLLSFVSLFDNSLSNILVQVSGTVKVNQSFT